MDTINTGKNNDNNFICKAGYTSINEVNTKFGEDVYACNGCPNCVYRDGMLGCKLLGGN